MNVDIQEEDERIKRFIVAVDGEQVTLSYVEGSQVAALAYVGFHGNAQLTLPADKLEVAIDLLTRMQAFLTPPEPEPMPVDPDTEIPEESEEPSPDEE